MGENKKIREYKIVEYGRISESDITEFCRTCKRLQPDNSCRFFDPDYQAHLVSQGECNMAIVRGKGGTMTREGFKTFF